jgi:hypothetical protein
MLVQGIEVLERKFGFVPDFHDDHVESILITADGIEMVIRTEDGLSRLQKRDGARFKIIFQGVREFSFKGVLYGTVSIILDLLFFEKPADYEFGYVVSSAEDYLKCSPEITVVSCGYTINSPTSLEIRADMSLNASVLEEKQIELITDLKLDSNKPKPRTNNCSLTVYFTSGKECVWDIARIYNASVDEIIKINNIQGEYINDGSMILVPTL